MDSSLAVLRREAALKALVPLFFLSGATSLVYETLWSRSLHLVFGTSQVAIATVLAAFMGGLSLGGLLMARYADRVRRPLLVYGVLEGVIGLYALLFDPLVAAMAPLYQGFWLAFEPSPLVFSAFQAALVGTMLLVPTSCMGATLPLLARFVTTHLDLAGRRVGLLYGVNTAGAVFGTFLAGFVLLPGWGLSRTTWAAAIANLALMGAAVLLSRQADGATPPVVEHEETEIPARPQRALLLVAALAGFAALVYELAWFRLMTLTLGGSAYAFTVMLLAFLAGMAGGGWWGGRLADSLLAGRGRLGLLLGLALSQLGVLGVSWAMMHGYGQLPFIYVYVYDAVERAPELFWPAQVAIAASVMTPPAVLMGISFTLAVRALVTDPRRLGGPVGQIYGANTIGGILGSLTAAFLLLPWLQVIGTVLVAGAANALAALVALYAARGVRGRGAARQLSLVAGLVAATVVTGLVWRPVWNPLLMTSGMFKYVAFLSERTRARVISYAITPYDLLYYKEGLSSVVTVARNKKTGNIWLANNGKVDASTTSDMPTQMLIGHLPFFFGRQPEKACVIGLASGITAGAVSLHRDLERIDVVELAPAVVEASHFFDEYNHRPLDDPRVRLVLNDGRNHLQLMPDGSYDVVVSEPSNPWLTGVSNLFTLEFFQQGRAKLAPGGIWSQWVQMYGMGTEELRALLRTFAEVFPYVALFATIEDADLVVLGSDQPLELDLGALEEVIRTRPQVVSDLNAMNAANAYDLLTYFQMDRETVLGFVMGAELNTDDNMLVEFMAPRRLYIDTSSRNYRILLNEARPGIEPLRDLGDFKQLSLAYARRDELVRALIVLKEADARFPGDDQVQALYSHYQEIFLKDQAEAEKRRAEAEEKERQWRAEARQRAELERR